MYKVTIGLYTFTRLITLESKQTSSNKYSDDILYFNQNELLRRGQMMHPRGWHRMEHIKDTIYILGGCYQVWSLFI